MKYFFFSRTQKGFGAIETLLSVAIFVFVAVAIYSTYVKIFDVVQLARVRTAAIALGNEQMEIVRNLPYAQVGEKLGIPLGVLPPTRVVSRGPYNFQIDTTVRNYDDPFDGQLGSTTYNDLSPADSKLVELRVICVNCDHPITPVVLTTRVGPKNLESASTNGALFVHVLDGSGVPVAGANVHIVNSSASVVIDDVTNSNGTLQIIDAPPGANAYAITVTKNGYTTERTYAIGSTTAPNPVKPDATVLVQTVTEITFVIDLVTTLNVWSVKSDCSPVPGISFELEGTKLISAIPDVLKYGIFSEVTDGTGYLQMLGMEWDTYAVTVNSGAYDLAGTIPLPPLVVAPGSIQDLYFVLANKDPDALTLTVKDSATGLPVAGASVTLGRSGASTTMVTGRGFQGQTDWSGGSGQSTSTDLTRYWSDDGNVETASPAGDLRLREILGEYVPTATLESSIFDTGSGSNFYEFLSQPINQPFPGTTTVEFQIATSNSTTTWNYYGPDGTAGTYYTSTSTTIHSVHAGHRYFRYKAFLETSTTTQTPSLSDVNFTYTSSCMPPGQVFFDELTAGTYNVEVSKSGYTTVEDTVTIASPWQEYVITIAP